MSRSGYSDDGDNRGLWRGAVRRATTGYRGQHLLRKLGDALDAMPTKRLITDAIKNEAGEVCALGALDSTVDAYDAEVLAEHFGIARALAAEIVYRNDEDSPLWQRDSAGFWVRSPDETPEQRWIRMRAWVDKQIIPDEPEAPTHAD